MISAKKLTLSLIATVILAFSGNTVAQAGTLDLSLVTASGTINGGIFSRFEKTGQGSGNFDSFVRIQGTGNATTEKGYNTDGTPEFDTKNGAFTHSILLSQIPLVTIGGKEYREFLLDAGESNSADKDNIYLDRLDIYLLSSASIDSYPFSEAPLFTLNGDNILLDNVVGNGSADMFAYIPNDVFKNDSDPYLYLYSEFSEVDGTYEEWGRDPNRKSTSPVPEPATAMLFGSGLLGALVRKRFV